MRKIARLTRIDEHTAHPIKETEYDINIPLEARRWYVEGAGQLCAECWNKLYECSGGE